MIEQMQSTYVLRKKGTQISFFDNPDFKTSDDYTIITVEKDMDGCEFLNNLEMHKFGGVKKSSIQVKFYEHKGSFRNGLNGKVSAFKISLSG